MIKQLIIDNQNLIRTKALQPRSYHFFDDLLKIKKIVSFIGPRRSGKTFLMLQFVQELVARGLLQREQVVFLDFSLSGYEKLQSNELLSIYKSLYPDLQPFFIFDEIQEKTDFKNFVLTLYNQGFQIFLSGSNAHLLSAELSTHFRGRVFEYQVLPLTFAEVARFKGFSLEKHQSSEQLGKLKHLLDEVLQYGTFPEIVLAQDALFKKDLLKSYLDILIYKDLLERYKIENELALKYLMKTLALSNSKMININKCYNELKSQGIAIGKTTLYEYYEHLKTIFYLYPLNNYYSPRGSQKSFLYNRGFSSLFSPQPNFGQHFENLILFELLYHKEQVFFKKNGKEIDFSIGEDTNFQVCYHLNSENLPRELAPFKNQKETPMLIYAEHHLTPNQLEKASETAQLISFDDFLLNT